MNTKKSIKFIALGLIASSSLLAQKQLQVKAFITQNNDAKLSIRPLFVEKIKSNKIWYRTKENDVKITSISTAKVKSIFFSKPQDFVDAVDLFDGRRYKAALKSFAAIKVKYDNFSDFNDSIPVLAALYELECLRKLKQYDKFAEVLEAKSFSKGRYVASDANKTQLEIYQLWIDLQTDENLPEIKQQYEAKWKAVKLPNYQRAQLEFIYGKTLEAEGNDGDALIAYAKAMNADFAGSEIISLEALEASLSLISRDEEVIAIRKLLDTRKRAEMKLKVNTAGYVRLLEASALVRIHNKLALSGLDSIGKPIQLDDNFASFGKYTKENTDKLLK